MSSYISDLRKIVGKRCLIQAAASIILEREDGKVLLGKRTDNHMWGYAGGAIEIDEKAEEAAKRELMEETGFIADEITFFLINSGPKAHYIYPNGDEVSNVEIIYLCHRFHGHMKKQQDEIEELKWFDMDEIPSLLISPPIRPVMEQYLAYRKQQV